MPRKNGAGRKEKGRGGKRVWKARGNGASFASALKQRGTGRPRNLTPAAESTGTRVKHGSGEGREGGRDSLRNVWRPKRRLLGS